MHAFFIELEDWVAFQEWREWKHARDASAAWFEARCRAELAQYNAREAATAQRRREWDARVDAYHQSLNVPPIPESVGRPTAPERTAQLKHSWRRWFALEPHRG